MHYEVLRYRGIEHHDIDRRAGCGPDRIGNHDLVCSRIARRAAGDIQRGTCGTRDIHSVLLPLVIERCLAPDGHVERERLARAGQNR